MTIDVAHVLSNPDFITQLSRARKKQSFDAGGNVVETVDYLPFMGSITPKDGTLFIEYQGQRIAKTVRVITTTELCQGNGAESPADSVAWKGMNYLVKHSMDYSAWGDGFYDATCEFQ